MCKVKKFMYISDPRHPRHHLFLEATNTKKFVSPPKKNKGAGGKGAVNVLGANRPKYSYVLSENPYRI